MLRILGARYPLAQVRVLPVRVQGEGAAEEIAAALDWANLHQAADLIITGRGDVYKRQAVILAYAIKSLVENLSKHNNWPDRSGKKEETTHE